MLNDWGTSYLCARAVGDRCLSLVDLGHHAPNVNIEQIVAQLIQLGGLGGFHFNDSKFGDDDLDAGSIKPFQLFLVFNELVDAELEGVPGFAPAYMLDQSHNVTDPLESLMTSAMEVVRAYVQAHLVDRAGARATCRTRNDAAVALQTAEAGVHDRRLADPGDGPRSAPAARSIRSRRIASAATAKRSPRTVRRRRPAVPGSSRTGGSGDRAGRAEVGPRLGRRSGRGRRQARAQAGR